MTYWTTVGAFTTWIQCGTSAILQLIVLHTQTFGDTGGVIGVTVTATNGHEMCGTIARKAGVRWIQIACEAKNNSILD